MPPILNPAPPWQPDLSDYIVLWHGCTVFDKTSVEAHGIDLAYCRVDTDFGRGFYTTTLLRQARQWAWSRFYAWQSKNPGVTGNQPVVLCFRVRRYGLPGRKKWLDRGLDKLLSLHFVVGDYHNEDYWSLVQHCRQSTPPNPATGAAAVVRDHRRPPGGWYDLVAGPVAAFWEQRVAMDDADQFSFHTKDAVKILNALIKSGKRGKKDDCRWEPVAP